MGYFRARDLAPGHRWEVFCVASPCILLGLGAALQPARAETLGLSFICFLGMEWGARPLSMPNCPIRLTDTPVPHPHNP